MHGGTSGNIHPRHRHRKRAILIALPGVDRSIRFQEATHLALINLI